MRRTTLGIIVVMGAVAGLRALAQDSTPAVAPDSSQVRREEASEPPDLTGYWRLDRQRSDPPRARDGAGGPRRPGLGRSGGAGGRRGLGEGGAMGRGRPGGGRPDERGARPARLPDLMHVTHATTLVSFEDSTGTVLQEITTVAASADTSAHARGARHLTGQWNEGRLTVQHAGRRGFKVSEIYSLEEDGRTLVIRTTLESADTTGSREFKRVYQRES